MIDERVKQYTNRSSKREQIVMLSMIVGKEKKNVKDSLVSEKIKISLDMTIG